MIEIEGKTPAEIFTEFEGLVNPSSGNARELVGVRDYREDLLTRAKAEADAGNSWIAITLYAILIEHMINATLERVFDRRKYDTEVIKPLLRELRLQTKTTALRAIAGLPPISQDDLKLLDQIIQFRNSFVHYKWISYVEEDKERERDRQLNDIAERAEGLVSTLQAMDSTAFWNDRESEIIEYIHQEVERRWNERGAFNLEVPPAVIDE